MAKVVKSFKASSEAEKSETKKGKRAAGPKPENVTAIVKAPEPKLAGKVKTPEKKGAKSIAEKSEAELQAEIKELLKDLEDATSSGEKKRIRRALRARGHRGGLGQRKPKAKANKPTKAKTKVEADDSDSDDVEDLD